MKLRFSKSVLVFSAALALSLTACSKKKVKPDEGDTAADRSMNPTEVGGGAGARIPELGTVYFAYDSFELNGAAKSALNGHAEWLKAHPGTNVQVEGHCDERGTTEYNLALGERRAGVVKDFLVNKGVPSSQLSTISYGEERPAVPGHDEAAWSKNRRAEFVNAGK